MDEPLKYQIHDKNGTYSIVDIETMDELDGFTDSNLVNKVTLELNTMNDLIQELYLFRLTYNALLFNEWCNHMEYEVYKSRKHNNGEVCFDGEWFIVVANLPTGQITNHYHIDYWDYFKIPSYERAKDIYDGHTPQDVLYRLQKII